MYRSFMRFGGVLLVFFVFSGCGQTTQLKGLVPVRGVVTLNGTPVERAQIQFLPVESSSGARVGGALSKSGGAFQAMTLQPNDGLFPGEYHVTVQKNTVTTADDGVNTITNNLPERYADKATTPLTVTIDPKGERNLKLELTP